MQKELIQEKSLDSGRTLASMLLQSILVASGAITLTIFSQLSIKLAFTPVPVTGQTLAVIVIGAVLGSRRGALAIIAYLSAGIAGLPVFATWGSGPAYLLGPTGGYLIGFVASAYISGLFVERNLCSNLLTAFPLMLLANSVVFLSGILWLTFYIGSDRVLEAGLYPFITGGLIKVAIASVLIRLGMPGIKKLGIFLKN